MKEFKCANSCTSWGGGGYDMPETEMFWTILIISLVIVIVLSMLAVFCTSILLDIISRVKRKRSK